VVIEGRTAADDENTNVEKEETKRIKLAPILQIRLATFIAISSKYNRSTRDV
jgi:hypothetical protein